MTSKYVASYWFKKTMEVAIIKAIIATYTYVQNQTHT